MSHAIGVINDKLRSAKEPLPEDLGLARLTAWAETRFGTAPAEYRRRESFRRAGGANAANKTRVAQELPMELKTFLVLSPLFHKPEDLP